MSKSQREKGKRWERAVAASFRAAMPGAEIKRGWQARSGSDAADVECPHFWVECKVGKRPPIMRALEQAEEAAGSDPRVPIAVCKQDRELPTVTMRLDDFLDLVREWWQRGQA